jgi:hypothetical protein
VVQCFQILSLSEHQVNLVRIFSFHDFNRHKVTSNLVPSQIYFTIATLSQRLDYLILCRATRRIEILPLAYVYVLFRFDVFEVVLEVFQSFSIENTQTLKPDIPL